jgi:tripeptidyl-peptidase I
MRSMRATSFLQPNTKPATPETDVAVAGVQPISAATVPSSCSSSITPACLRAMYNTSTYTPAVSLPPQACYDEYGDLNA